MSADAWPVGRYRFRIGRGTEALRGLSRDVHQLAQKRWNVPNRWHIKKGTDQKTDPLGFGFGFVSDPVKDTNGKPCQKVGKADDHSDRHNLFGACHRYTVLILLFCEP